MAAIIGRSAISGVTAALGLGVIGGDIPQNQRFTTTFNRGALIVQRPVKIVIVDQDPAPGDFVPAGTPVTVTVVEKGLIPPQSFTGISQDVVGKYSTIGALEDDLATANDPTAAAAKAVLGKGVAFDQLSAADKTAVTNFVTSRKIAGDSTKAASDISMLYQL
jgi:hypothetical protein